MKETTTVKGAIHGGGSDYRRIRTIRTIIRTVINKKGINVNAWCLVFITHQISG